MAKIREGVGWLVGGATTTPCAMCRRRKYQTRRPRQSHNIDSTIFCNPSLPELKAAEANLFADSSSSAQRRRFCEQEQDDRRAETGRGKKNKKNAMPVAAIERPAHAVVSQVHFLPTLYLFVDSYIKFFPPQNDN